MAGRDFGPPPYIVPEFSVIWRNWLNLVYRKIYKRTFVIELPAYNSVPHSTNPMTEARIGITPVVLADDTTAEFRALSFYIPVNWIVGSDIIIKVNLINTTLQVGVKTINTRISYLAYTVNELADAASTPLLDVLTLANNVAANTAHQSGILTIPGSALALNDTVSLYLQRQAGSDTCVGDVGYQSLLIEYQGLLNQE